VSNFSENPLPEKQWPQCTLLSHMLLVHEKVLTQTTYALQLAQPFMRALQAR